MTLVAAVFAAAHNDAEVEVQKDGRLCGPHVEKKTWACPKMRYEGYTVYPLKNSNFNETVRINHDILLVPYFGQAQILD